MAKTKVEKAFHEVMHNKPKIVAHTEKKYGAERAHKQEVAIALAKARRAGAKIPGPNSPCTAEDLARGYGIAKED